MTMFSCPSDSDLRIAIQFILLKSVQNKRISSLHRVSLRFVCFKMIVLFLRFSIFCPARMSLLCNCSCGVLTMRQIRPSSVVIAPLKASSIDRKYNTRVLLANIWHRMGIGSWHCVLAETQATWLLTDKSALPTLVRL